MRLVLTACPELQCISLDIAPPALLSNLIDEWSSDVAGCSVLLGGLLN